MTWHFAWARPSETDFGPEHQREDEEVFAFRIDHSEGDFAMLSIEIRNPRRQLLQGEDVWMWLALDATPLFFGRLVAVPEDLHGEIVTLNFRARPAGYDAAKRALAETLRIAPWWDPVWILDERIDDPDVVLEARTQLWHIDRVTHAVTVSDILEGEDGTLALSGDEILRGSLAVTYGAPPVHRVRVEAEVSWDQAATGELDISRELIAAFAAAGSGNGLISSYTGQGLEADWPEAGDDLKGGWSIAEATLQRADGVWTEPKIRDVGVAAAKPTTDESGARSGAFFASPFSARFYLWEFLPVLRLGYAASRQRIERIRFDLVGDVQPVVTDAGDQDEIIVSAASRKVSEPLVEGAAPPIGDVRRASYVRTDRGLRSLHYLIALARAKLLARARAVEIRVTAPLERALDLSCRHSVTITDLRLPGGAATGKVISYALIADGNGSRRAEITIGCTIGMGAAVTPEPGTPVYGDGYGDGGWQAHDGRTVMAVAGEVTHGELGGVPIADDGIDFFRLQPADVIRRLEVINGRAAQDAVLDERYPDIPAAVEALNAKHTEVWLELAPLTGGPFKVTYDVPVSPLMVPATIRL